MLDHYFYYLHSLRFDHPPKQPGFSSFKRLQVHQRSGHLLKFQLGPSHRITNQVHLDFLILLPFILDQHCPSHPLD